MRADGSFVQKLEYLEAVGNTTGNPWGGYWITITGDYVFGDETMIGWATYLCSSGVVNGTSRSGRRSDTKALTFEFA